jgi:hypothetical protein
MAEILLDGGSHIDFPILLLVNPTASEETLSLKGVLRGNNKTRGECPLLFTNMDLVNRYRESSPALARYVVFELRNQQEAMEFLDTAEKGGCGYVAFARTGNRARFVSVANFRKAIHPH